MTTCTIRHCTNQRYKKNHYNLKMLVHQLREYSYLKSGRITILFLNDTLICKLFKNSLHITTSVCFMLSFLFSFLWKRPRNVGRFESKERTGSASYLTPTTSKNVQTLTSRYFNFSKFHTIIRPKWRKK